MPNPNRLPSLCDLVEPPLTSKLTQSAIFFIFFPLWLVFHTKTFSFPPFAILLPFSLRSSWTSKFDPIKFFYLFPFKLCSLAFFPKLCSFFQNFSINLRQKMDAFFLLYFGSVPQHRISLIWLECFFNLMSLSPLFFGRKEDGKRVAKTVFFLEYSVSSVLYFNSQSNCFHHYMPFDVWISCKHTLSRTSILIKGDMWIAFWILF